MKAFKFATKDLKSVESKHIDDGQHASLRHEYINKWRLECQNQEYQSIFIDGNATRDKATTKPWYQLNGQKSVQVMHSFTVPLICGV